MAEMLSEPQQKRVWEGILAAEYRGCYFADVASGSITIDRWMGLSVLFLSAGFVGWSPRPNFQPPPPPPKKG